MLKTDSHKSIVLTDITNIPIIKDQSIKKDIPKIEYISEDNKNILYPLNYIR
jgi:hypothetical protein